MDWLIWLIIGAFAWQGVATITFIVTNEDEGKTALVGAGLIIILAWGIVTLIRMPLKAARKRKRQQIKNQ